MSIELPPLNEGEDKTSPFRNRIRKNYKHVRKWAKRSNTNCFRIYDREVPQYPLAIDLYAGRFCIQYFARPYEDESIAAGAFEQAQSALEAIFCAPLPSIYCKTRIRRAKMQQYEKIAQANEYFTAIEHGAKFKINLVDYLDTGLFLDHRETRQVVAKACTGKRLLNLFAYTCSFSVQAALAGATYTKSVDMSNTYTTWGRENFVLNEISSKNHPIVRSDYSRFLDSEIKSGAKYEIIVIDPPTISRSKKMSQMFDVQIDYESLLHRALKLLCPGGSIFFSTNLRSFTFNFERFPHCLVQDISSKTIPIDFHDPFIHRCWQICPK